MSSAVFSILCIVAFSASAFSQSGTKAGRFEIFDPIVYGLHKEIEKVLQLTDDQISKLEEARTARDENAEFVAAREAHQADKSNDALKKAFYVAQDAAKAEYRGRIHSILTPEQLSLVENLNTVAASEWKETEGAGNWPERQKILGEKAPEILRAHLNPEQQAILGIDSAPAPPAQETSGQASP